jgi:hypothetical protein
LNKKKTLGFKRQQKQQRDYKKNHER